MTGNESLSVGGCQEKLTQSVPKPSVNPLFYGNSKRIGVSSAYVMDKVRKAKKEGRSELSPEAWFIRGFAYGNEFSNLEEAASLDNIERVDYHKCCCEDFELRFEKQRKPCVITGAMDDWPANENWKEDQLIKKYGRRKFKCGEDDDGYPVKMRLSYFFHYISNQRDDSPMYVFDSHQLDKDFERVYGEDTEFDEEELREHGLMLKDYEVPKYFTADLFKYVGEERRPPYRWFVCGPARSGTGIHIDPLGTAAWNALIFGHKRWGTVCSWDRKARYKTTVSYS